MIPKTTIVRFGILMDSGAAIRRSSSLPTIPVENFYTRHFPAAKPPVHPTTTPLLGHIVNLQSAHSNRYTHLCILTVTAIHGLFVPEIRDLPTKWDPDSTTACWSEWLKTSAQRYRSAAVTPGSSGSPGLPLNSRSVFFFGWPVLRAALLFWSHQSECQIATSVIFGGCTSETSQSRLRALEPRLNSTRETARVVGTSHNRVWLWRQRCATWHRIL